MGRNIPKPEVNNKTWVSDMINFEDYTEYVKYTKDFDWEETRFLYDFLFETLKYLMTHNGDPLKITLEENVTLIFQLNLTQQTIVMGYYDERVGSIVEYDTCSEEQAVPYTRLYGNPMVLKTIRHRVINKPIQHSCKLRFTKTGTHYDFDKTIMKFMEAFILFANVIDKEHEEMIWLMEQKEKENRLPKYPTPPKPRIIK